MIVRKFFKADIREPYMGNTLPLKFEVFIDTSKKNGIEMTVINSEGIRTEAHEITIKVFKE